VIEVGWRRLGAERFFCGERIQDDLVCWGRQRTAETLRRAFGDWYAAPACCKAGSDDLDQAGLSELTFLGCSRELAFGR
jgi:hypothetical protein